MPTQTDPVRTHPVQKRAPQTEAGTTRAGLVAAAPAGIVHGELLDAIIEAVVRAGDPAARAAVVNELVHEMCATLEWLHDSDPELGGSPAEELLSIARLSRAARDHQQQMVEGGHNRH